MKNRYKFDYLINEDLWELQENIKLILSNGDKITIPIGMKTDGRSSPRFLRAILPQFTKHILVYLIHDWLYINDYKWDELGTKKAQMFADKEMLYWQNRLKMNPIESYLCYYAVRVFGRRVFVK